MYSSICPIGAPLRDPIRTRKPAQKPARRVIPEQISSQYSRRNGIVFNVDDHLQELKDIVGNAGSSNTTDHA
ncbi:hypothetical protein PSHT_01047 [Puccinia striiformis]|uniref:Uncharacterized protein n=1 Tax=Puccinia striiformis TaxID=27350 RepID=A0A2S4WLF1_9BASI|nr:hypothetical protein PSHT_01047 [Puccinia striiformis]